MHLPNYAGIAAIELLAMAGTAKAGGLTEPAAMPAPAPVTVVPAPVSTGHNWSGAYVGAGLGYGQLDADGFDADTDGASYGVHAGYLYDLGRFVVGAELEYDRTDIADSATGIDLDAVARLKARAGYDAGAFLPYVTAGVAQVSTSGAVEADDNGYFAGLGVDYQFTDSLRVGAEVLQHQFNDFDATTAAVRIGYNF